MKSPNLNTLSEYKNQTQCNALINLVKVSLEVEREIKERRRKNKINKEVRDVRV